MVESFWARAFLSVAALDHFLKTMPRGAPGPLKRPAAAEPSSRPKAKSRSAAAIDCVRSAWSESRTATLASLREDMAKSMGVEWRHKIAVASLSAEVSSVLGVDFPHLSHVAAFTNKKGEAAPQLVSQAGAKHVFELGDAMCVRHGRRCLLSDCPTVDVLIADKVVDLTLLTTAMSVAQPRIVVVLAVGAHNEDRLKTTVGSGWEVSSVIKRAGSLGLPLRCEIAFHFLRRPGTTDPAQFLSNVDSATVVPMKQLLKSVEPSLEEGWDLISAKTRETLEPEDEKTVVAEVAKNLHLPGRDADLVPYSFPPSVWAKLSPARKRRAVGLLAWAVHSAEGGSACCDLDAARGAIYMEAALPDTGGLKMFLAVRRTAAGSLVAKTLSPYHILAVRGYAQPGQVNLSTLGPAVAQRAAEAAMPAPAATAAILAVIRAKKKM